MDLSAPEENEMTLSLSQKTLFENEVIKIKYPLRLTKLCYESNSKIFDRLLRQKANIYALWTKKPSCEDWTLMYVGHHTHRYMRSHLRHHFFKKPERVVSQLPLIKKYLLNGYEIGLSVAYMQPEELRCTVEKLVGHMREQNLCEWNSL